VLPEYMMMSKPIVATTIDAIPEIVGNAGLLAEVDNVDEIADKISQIIDHPEIRDELVKNGKTRVIHFNAERMVDEHVKLFRQMIKAFSEHESLEDNNG
jgi:glycosyltransferase involved in cell wall biosynthesis